MRIRALLIASLVSLSMPAAAQSDLILLLNPFPNEERFIFNSHATLVQTVDDKTTGRSFRQNEQKLALR